MAESISRTHLLEKLQSANDTVYDFLSGWIFIIMVVYTPLTHTFKFKKVNFA